jgi:hypothetical protein
MRRQILRRIELEAVTQRHEETAIAGEHQP